MRWFQKSDGPKKEICGCLPTFWPITLHFYGPVKLKKIGIALVDSYSACSDRGSEQLSPLIVTEQERVASISSFRLSVDIFSASYMDDSGRVTSNGC